MIRAWIGEDFLPLPLRVMQTGDMGNKLFGDMGEHWFGRIWPD